MKEVYPGIFRITERGKLGMLKPPVNIYVITGRNGLVFDAGYGDPCSIRRFTRSYKEIVRICSERGETVNINRVLLSHAHSDHFSGLRKLRKKFRFRVIISGEMKKIISSSEVYRKSYAPAGMNTKKSISEFIKYLPRKMMYKIEYLIYSAYWGISFMDDPDLLIDPGTTIEINDEEWEIFSSPGHSFEHITLYNRNKGILFSGDNVMKSINVWLGPPKSDIDQYEASLKKMSELPDLKIILPAHGSPILNPYERLAEIIEWRKKRTGDVAGVVRSSSPHGISINGILDKLYPSDTRLKKDFARGWIELTLHKLEREKFISGDKDKFYYNNH